MLVGDLFRNKDRASVASTSMIGALALDKGGRLTMFLNLIPCRWTITWDREKGKTLDPQG